MLLVNAIFDVDFLKKHQLYVELGIDENADWSKFEIYQPYVRTIHLPYDALNLAARNAAERRRSIEVFKDIIHRAAIFDARTMILHPCGVFSFKGEDVGEYGFLIDSLRELADFADQRSVIISLENQVLRHPDLRIIAGCYADEWFQLHKDVARANITLTLDTSHAASAVAHEEVIGKRYEKLWDFMSKPELITHFHWSDARLQTNEAQWGDMHLTPGSGDLPREFHQAIMRHNGSKLFEQNCPPEVMESALAFARSLL